MKKLLLILLILLIPSLGYCEELWQRGRIRFMTKDTHPIYFGYVEDYSQLLRKAFKQEKMFKMCHWGSQYHFTLTREGEIKDISVGIYQNDYFDKKVKDIILSVQPLPFRAGMDLEELYFTVYMGYENYDEFYFIPELYRWTDEVSFSITIIVKK